MGTAFSDVITNYSMPIIDDARLDALLEVNPALFMRKVSAQLVDAIPRFNRPANIQDWLTYTPPSYTSYREVIVNAQTAPYVVQTGVIGFPLFSIGIVSVDVLGNATYTQYSSAAYDSTTGAVTFSADIPAGTRFDMDFYSDGEFTNDLTATQQYILGLCHQYVWELRFATNFLAMTPKINDKSFSTPNEANAVRANTERLRFMEESLNDTIISYENNLAYTQTIPQDRQISNGSPSA